MALEPYKLPCHKKENVYYIILIRRSFILKWLKYSCISTCISFWSQFKILLLKFYFQHYPWHVHLYKSTNYKTCDTFVLYFVSFVKFSTSLRSFNKRLLVKVYGFQFPYCFQNCFSEIRALITVIAWTAGIFEIVFVFFIISSLVLQPPIVRVWSDE